MKFATLIAAIATSLVTSVASAATFTEPKDATFSDIAFKGGGLPDFGDALNEASILGNLELGLTTVRGVLQPAAAFGSEADFGDFFNVTIQDGHRMTLNTIGAIVLDSGFGMDPVQYLMPGGSGTDSGTDPLNFVEFDNLSFGSGNYDFGISYPTTGPMTVALEWQVNILVEEVPVSDVPVPASGLLLLAGIGALTLRSQKKRA